MTDAAHATIASTMVSLCARRGPDKTCCPSEVARAVAPSDWRAWMPAVREVAATLHTRGEVRIVQRGRIVSPDAAIHGPIRLQIGPHHRPDPT